VAGLALAALFGCAAGGSKVLPSASEPAAQRAGAANYREVRVENGGHRGIVWDLAFSPDGRRLYSAGDDKVVRVWDVPSATLQRVLRIPIGPAREGAIYALAISPDERWIAVGGCHGCTGFWDGSNLLFVLDAASGRIAGVGEGHHGSIHALAFSPDGRHLASGSVDTELRLWTVAPDGALAPEARLAAHGGAVMDVAWFPDGRHLVSAGADGLALIWSPHRDGGFYPELALKGHGSAVTSVDVTPDGSRVVSGSIDGTIRAWSARTGEALGVLIEIRDAIVLAVRVARDGTQLAYGSGGALDATGVGTLPLVPMAPAAQFAPSADSVHSLAWSRDGARVANSEGQFGSIALRRSADLSRRALAGSGAAILGVGFTERGFAWRQERAPDAWREGFDTASLAIEPVAPESVGVGYPDPRIANVVLNDGGAGFARVIGSPELRTRASTAPLLCWSLFGQSRLALGSELALHIVDLRDDSRRDCWGHESLVDAVAPLAGGAVALTGSADQTLRFWDASSCRERLAFYRDAHAGWVAWAPDGGFMASRGAEALLGVHQNHGARAAPSFTPVEESARRTDLFDTAIRRAD
jgi:WD40 repeat protein